jgi:hypothetical protein
MDREANSNRQASNSRHHLNSHPTSCRPEYHSSRPLVLADERFPAAVTCYPSTSEQQHCNSSVRTYTASFEIMLTHPACAPGSFEA